MALDFWFVTYILQKSVILREKKIKKKKNKKAARFLQNLLSQLLGPNSISWKSEKVS